ncbi:MAG: ABC transporter substrate-binding protein, partial [Candidatus Binatia bacterium]
MHRIILLLLSFSLLAYSHAGAQSVKLRLGTTAATSTEKVVFALAKDAGILKKHDLELEVILITSGGTLAMQALIGKSIDLLTTGATPFLHGYLEDAEVKFIGGVNNKFIYSFMTRASITSGAQLKGKVVGITRFGSIDELATKTALAQLGLNPRTDVKIIQVGG